jgi:uncharacterized delta-60 repeat protein
VRADAGDLDPSFGDDGKTISDFFGFWDEATDVALQADGKIVAAGWTQTLGTDDDFALARFTASGALDQSFGISGKVTTDFFESIDQAQALVIQPDGKIVVAGLARAASGFNEFAVARYNSDGSLDDNFGMNGKVTTSFPDASAHAHDLALQSDGKIVAGGIVTRPPFTSSTFALTRYLQDGTVDTTFGINDWATADFFPVEDDFQPPSRLNAIAIQENGAIVAAGSASRVPGFFDFAVARFQPSGTLDKTFASKGKRTIDFFRSHDEGRDVAIQRDGRIVIVGFVFNPTSGKAEFGVARLTPAGDLDTEFGGGSGLVADHFDALSAAATCLTLQPDNKIVVAGTAEFRRRNDNLVDDAFAALRLTRNGSLDRSFGSEGRTIQDFGELSDEPSAIAIDSDGSLVLAGGSANFQTNVDFTVVRYRNDIRFPRINSVSVSGKRLFVEGTDFDDGASVLLNGQKQKTANDGEQPANRLLCKKAGKKIRPGDTIKVRNSNGVESAEFVFP